MQIPGACVCFQAPNISQHNKFLHLWFRKNWFALERKLDCVSFRASSSWKRICFARTVFLQVELSSFTTKLQVTTKLKVLEMWNLNLKLSKDNTVLWGSPYPKTHTYPGTLCSFTLISSRCTAQEMTLIQQEALSFAACNCCRAAESKTRTNFAIKWQHPMTGYLRAEGTSGN